MSEKIGKILYTQEDILKRAKEIADEINRDYDGEEVILLCTLKGSLLWIADVMKNLTVNTKLDFISASSYGASKTSSGVVKIKFDPEINMYNANILVVEDIVDTGNTLKYVLAKLQESVAVSFWEKPDAQHTVVRLATSWSTTDEDLKALDAALTGAGV